MKNRKMENRSVRWFGLTDLNKTMGKMSGRLNSDTYTGDEMCHSHLTHNIVNYCMRRFFFGLVYVVGTHWNCLYEAIPIYTNNICY